MPTLSEESKSRLGLQPWYIYEPEGEVEFDIVAVHGLAADPYWTWAASPPAEPKKPRSLTWTGWPFTPATSPAEDASAIQLRDPPNVLKKETIWLRDLLPYASSLERSRVLGFGYRSDYLMDAPHRTIEALSIELLNDLTRARKDIKKHRPVFFICHCFGGIVVKELTSLEALIRATLDRRYEQIRKSVHGIIFLGTPHRGASIAGYGEMILRIVAAAGLGADSELVSNLTENCKYLHKLASYFNSIYDDFEVFCFYELRPWKFGVRVVEAQSAVLDETKSKGLDTDHSGLNKFRDSNDPNLKSIIEILSDMATNARRLARERVRKSMDEAELRQRIDVENSWKSASQLVIQIDERYRQIFGRIYADTDDEVQSRKASAGLHLSRCRFEGWAYTMGLIDFYDSRRQLHATLEGTGAFVLCSKLRDLLEALERVSNAISDKDADYESEIQLDLSSINEFIDQLLTLLSAKENQDAVQNFQTRLIRNDSISYLESAVAACRDQGLFDQEVIAAMKRLQLLISQSESEHPEGELFFINRSQLDFGQALHSYNRLKLGWKLSSEPESDGDTDNGVMSSPGRRDYPVLVEWKKYTGLWDTEIGNILFDRTVTLTKFLKTASSKPDLRLLPCIGYSHDDTQKMIGLVFQAPTSTGYLTLNEVIASRSKSMPSLTERFELAQILAQAIFEVHSGGWLHKAFNSHQVIYFPQPFSSAESGSEAKQQPGEKAASSSASCSIISPYIVGFIYSRPDRPLEFSEPGSITAATARYCHPHYKSEERAMKKFGRIYDYYSLGVTLLEIALWHTLEKMESRWGLRKCSRTQFRDALVVIAKETLPSRVGRKYRDAVLACLCSEETFAMDNNSAETETGRAKQLNAFCETVVNTLRGCCA